MNGYDDTQVMATVNGLGGVVSSDVPAALVAIITERPLPAVCHGQVVTSADANVPHQELPVLVQVAEQVLGIIAPHAIEAVPIAAAVVWVRIEAPHLELVTVYLLVLGGAVGGPGRRGLAVQVALVADWPPVTVNVLSVIAVYSIVIFSGHQGFAPRVVTTQIV